MNLSIREIKAVNFRKIKVKILRESNCNLIGKKLQLQALIPVLYQISGSEEQPTTCTQCEEWHQVNT